MPLFLLFVFGVYSAVHAYAFLKLRAAFPFGMGAGLALGAFMAVMVFTPILVRILEGRGLEALARLLSLVGYSWAGVLFLFFSLSVLFDLYRILASLAGILLHRDMGALLPSARVSLLAPLLAGMAIALYGSFEALNIRPHRIEIRTPRLGGDVSRLRIVQVSDVHLGLIVREQRLGKIIRIIEEARPDMLISTGDLVDGQIDRLSDMADALAAVKPRFGKFAVTGNHEFYAGLEHSLAITKRAGFSVLRGESAVIPGVMSIAGVDDPTAGYMGLSSGEPEQALLARLPRDTFTLLLKHQPHVSRGSLGLYDLQLSGHTHNGQIFPFRYLVKLFFPLVTGLHELPGGSLLFISRGTGTWGPPVRFLSPPEVTVIDLVRGS